MRKKKITHLVQTDIIEPYYTNISNRKIKTYDFLFSIIHIFEIYINNVSVP